MRIFEFESESVMQGFGTTGTLFLDIESLGARGAIFVQGAVLNPSTNRYEGKAAVRLVSPEGERMVNDSAAAFTATWIGPIGGVSPGPGITAYPMYIEIHAANGGVIKTEMASFRLYPTSAPVEVLAFSLTLP